jgi:hypothetical protein
MRRALCWRAGVRVLVTLTAAVLAARGGGGCAPAEHAIEVEMRPDQFYWETSWFLQAFPAGSTLAAGEWAGCSVCVPAAVLASSRLVLTVQDLQRDGLGPGGGYRLLIDGVEAVSGGGSFGAEQVTTVKAGCTQRIRVELQPDANAEFETTWDIVDSGGATVASGDSSGGVVCALLASEYVFTIRDSFGDGLGRSGSYSVMYQGETVASGGRFRHTETTRFAPGCQHTIAVVVDAVGDSLFQQQPDPTWQLRDADPAAGGAVLLGATDAASLALCVNTTAFNFTLQVARADVTASLAYDGVEVVSGSTSQQDAHSQLSFSYRCAHGLCCPTSYTPRLDITTQLYSCANAMGLVLPNSCASAPCKHGGVCSETSGSFRCDCPMAFAGETCQWAAQLLRQSCGCAVAGCSCDVSVSLMGLLGNHLSRPGASYVLDSARLFTEANGDFSNDVAKFVASTHVNGASVAAMGAVCYPDCVCCSRMSPCLSALDVALQFKSSHNLSLSVDMVGSPRVGEGTGCPGRPSLSMRATMAFSLFRTLTVPCTCQGAGCSCLAQFSGIKPEGTLVDVAWLTVVGTGDLGAPANEYIASITADGSTVLGTTGSSVLCDCCAQAVPFVTRANLTAAAADGAVSVQIFMSSGADECGLAATATLGYSLVSVNMCLTSPCQNNGVCENRPSASGRPFTCRCVFGFSGDVCDVCGGNNRVLTVTLDTYPAGMDPAVLWTLYDDTAPDPVAGGQKLASKFFRTSNATVATSICTPVQVFKLITSNMGTSQWGTWQVHIDGVQVAHGIGDSTSEFGCTIVGSSFHCCPKGYTPGMVNSVLTCICNGHQLSVIIQPDAYPDEISFSIRAPSGGKVVLVGGYEGGTYCGSENSFEVRIKDSHNDGFCCGFGRGEYSLIVDGKLLVKQIADFRHEETAFLMATCSAIFEVGLLGPYQRVASLRDPFTQQALGVATNVGWSITRPKQHHTTQPERVPVIPNGSKATATYGCADNDCQSIYPGSACIMDGDCNRQYPRGYGVPNPSLEVLPRDQPDANDTSFWNAVPAFGGKKIGSVGAPGRTWYCIPELATDGWGVGTSYVLNVSDADGGTFGWDVVGLFYLKMNNFTYYSGTLTSKLGFQVNRDAKAPEGWALEFSCGPAKPPAYDAAWCCKPGFYTPDCIDFDECSVDNGGCDSHSKCTNTVGDFSCGVCADGWNGTRCVNIADGSNTEFRVEKAIANISRFATGYFDARYAGLWHSNEFECVDSTGWFVDGCVNVDDCYSSPCRNGGVCVDAVDAYHCECLHPYVGEHCQLYAHAASLEQRCICPANIGVAPCVCDISSLREAFPRSVQWIDIEDDSGGATTVNAAGQTVPLRIRTRRVHFWNGSISIVKTGDYFPDLSVRLNVSHELASHNISTNHICHLPTITQPGQCETPTSCAPSTDLQATIDAGAFDSGFGVTFRMLVSGGKPGKCADAHGTAVPADNASHCMRTGNVYQAAVMGVSEACTNTTNTSNCTAGVTLGTNISAAQCASAGGGNASCVYTASVTPVTAFCTNGGNALSRAACETTGNVYTPPVQFVLKQVPGCMESTAYNYNWKANVDDGKCRGRLETFTPPIDGMLIATSYIGTPFVASAPECAIACQASAECLSFNHNEVEGSAGVCFLYRQVALGKRTEVRAGYIFDFPAPGDRYYVRGVAGCPDPNGLNYRASPADGTLPTVKPWWIDCDYGLVQPEPEPEPEPEVNAAVASAIGSCGGASFGARVDFFVADQDDCLSIPCANGGTCTDGVDSFLCACKYGFRGKTCSEDIDECLSNPCKYGRCVDGNFSYSCLCESCDSCIASGGRCSQCGFSGENCSDCYGHHWELRIVPDSNPLDTSWTLRDVATNRIMLRGAYDGANFCQTASTYEFTLRDRFGDGFGGSWDVFADGFLQSSSSHYPPLAMVAEGVLNATAQVTLIDVNDCIKNRLTPTSGLCKAGQSICRDGINEYTCECLSGFQHCQDPGCLATCVPSEAAIGANATACYQADMVGNDATTSRRCREAGAGHCIYTSGRPYCEAETDECASIPCQNGGTCTDFRNNYTCNCLIGFRGYDCQVDPDECASLPCQNAGRCIDGINSYVCECVYTSTHYYEGAFCELSYYSGDVFLLLMVVCCLPLAFCLQSCRAKWIQTGSCIRGPRPVQAKYAVAATDDEKAALVSDSDALQVASLPRQARRAKKMQIGEAGQPLARYQVPRNQLVSEIAMIAWEAPAKQ